MAKKLGNDYRLFIESVTPGTFNEIKGQQDLSRSGGNSFIDTSTKDTGAYATKAASQREVSLSLNMLPDLPDANGYTRLEALCNAVPAAAFNIQVRKSPFAGGDVVFQALVYGDVTWQQPHNGAVSAAANFQIAAAPSVDALS